MSVNAYQPVLDPASSGRMFWFDKHDTRVLFGDIRDESWELCDGRRFDVKPDMEMDYRDLPSCQEKFDRAVSVGMVEHVGRGNYQVINGRKRRLRAGARVHGVQVMDEGLHRLVGVLIHLRDGLLAHEGLHPRGQVGIQSQSD